MDLAAHRRTRLSPEEKLDVMQVFRFVERRLLENFPDYFERNQDSRKFSLDLRNKDYVPSPGVDYSSADVYVNFDKSFFFLNLYKCLLACARMKALQSFQARPAIDLGCGSGVFSIAYSLVFPELADRLTLVDKGALQLRVASAFRESLELPPARLVRSDLKELSVKEESYLASYCFSSFAVSPSLLLGSFLPFKNRSICIIDYKPVVALITSSARQEQILFHGTIRDRPQPLILDTVNHPVVRTHFACLGAGSR